MLLFLLFLVCESNSLTALLPVNVTTAPASKNLMKQLMANPKQFVAELSHVDPTELQNIISLLEGLLQTSEGQAQELVDKVNDETEKALNTAEDLEAAHQAVLAAQAALEAAEQEHSEAQATHDAQEEQKAVAVQEHADGIGGLESEQQVLRDVIAMLKGMNGNVGWNLVLRQTHPFYQPINSWLSTNSGDPENDNYSIMDQLESFRGSDGAFEFKIVWPRRTAPNSNWWKQTSNPTSEAVAGYEALEVSFTSQYWGGLEYGTSGGPALCDGSVNHGNWFYAVGSKTQWGCGIPGAHDCETQTELWVHV